MLGGNESCAFLHKSKITEIKWPCSSCGDIQNQFHELIHDLIEVFFVDAPVVNSIRKST